MEQADRHWLDAPDEGGTLVTLSHRLTFANYVSGDPDGDRLRVRYYRHGEPPVLRGKVWFGPGTQGPPGHAHGGSMAAVLDEAMGTAAWVAGHTVVAAQISVRYRKMLPLGTLCRVQTRIVRVDGRKVHTWAAIQDRAGQTFTESDGLFVVIDPERFKEMLPPG